MAAQPFGTRLKPVIRLVADQHDQAMALGARVGERACDQRTADAALAERRLDRERPEQQRRRLADADPGEPHRADQQRADARRERQRERMRTALADAVGGFGVAPRAERALVQPLDRVRVVGRLGTNGQGKIAHATR
jgi:hypothetical protein